MTISTIILLLNIKHPTDKVNSEKVQTPRVRYACNVRYDLLTHTCMITCLPCARERENERTRTRMHGEVPETSRQRCWRERKLLGG